MSIISVQLFILQWDSSHSKLKGIIQKVSVAQKFGLSNDNTIIGNFIIFYSNREKF